MQKIRFGGLELKALFEMEEREADLVSIAELRKKLKLSAIQVRKLASRLVRKKRLIRLKRGLYLFAPMKAGKEGYWTEDSLASVPRFMEGKEHYVSFWAALNHYGLNEQIPIVIQIVTTKQQRNFEALQTRYEFVAVRHMGEWREEKICKNIVRIATMEQLIVDCLSMPSKGGGIKNAAQAIWTAQAKLDLEKLEFLASKTSEAVRRRLGYVCDVLKLQGMEHGMKPGKIVGWRRLDPSSGRMKLGQSKKWGLILNVSDKELVQWMWS